MPPSTTILTLGTGAIGGFYTARLSTVPHTTVSTICRSNHSAIAASGIQVLSPKFRDSRPFHPARVFRSTAEASEVTRRERRRWDYVLVTTKVVGEEWDRAVEGLIGEGTGIVVLQNGLGVEDDFWGVFGAREGVVIISAVTRFGCIFLLPHRQGY
jgi:2-dehydropantoate 2-reductase